jgi:hypothetical protein
VNHSFERVRLKITARDCGLAAEWTPSAQPFTLTWRDDHGGIHMDTGGDHDASMELELVRYFDVTCSNQPRADPELSSRPAAEGIRDGALRRPSPVSSSKARTGSTASTPVRGY